MDIVEVPAEEAHTYDVDELALAFEEAEDIQQLQRDKAVQMFVSILCNERDDEAALKLKEQAITK
jgi:predicted RNA-binding protein associated with RNAse of E/G family